MHGCILCYTLFYQQKRSGHNLLRPLARSGHQGAVGRVPTAPRGLCRLPPAPGGARGVDADVIVAQQNTWIFLRHARRLFGGHVCGHNPPQRLVARSTHPSLTPLSSTNRRHQSQQCNHHVCSCAAGGTAAPAAHACAAASAAAFEVSDLPVIASTCRIRSSS